MNNTKLMEFFVGRWIKYKIEYKREAYKSSKLIHKIDTLVVTSSHTFHEMIASTNQPTNQPFNKLLILFQFHCVTEQHKMLKKGRTKAIFRIKIDDVKYWLN